MEYLAKITAKGQMTLPLGIRKALHVDAGDYVRLEQTEDGSFLLKAGARVSELSGLIRYRGPARSAEEIRLASRATFER